MRKILFFLSICITTVYCNAFAQVPSEAPYVVLARRYRNSFGGANRTLRGDSFPKTRLSEKERERREAEGLIPEKKSVYERFIIERGYKPMNMDNYEKKMRKIPIEEEETSDSLLPYGIDSGEYENVMGNKNVGEKKKRKETGGFYEQSFDQGFGGDGLDDENSQEGFYDVNDILNKKNNQ